MEDEKKKKEKLAHEKISMASWKVKSAYVKKVLLKDQRDPFPPNDMRPQDYTRGHEEPL